MEYFLLMLFIILAKIDIKTNQKPKQIISTLFYTIKSLELQIFVKNWKERTNLLHFMEVLYQGLKNSQTLKNMPFVLWLPWQRGWEIIVIMLSNNNNNCNKILGEVTKFGDKRTKTLGAPPPPPPHLGLYS